MDLDGVEKILGLLGLLQTRRIKIQYNLAWLEFEKERKKKKKTKPGSSTKSDNQ